MVVATTVEGSKTLHDESLKKKLYASMEALRAVGSGAPMIPSSIQLEEAADQIKFISGEILFVISALSFDRVLQSILKDPEQVLPPFSLYPSHPLHNYLPRNSLFKVKDQPSLLLHGLSGIHLSEYADLRPSVKEFLEMKDEIQAMVGASGVGKT